MKRKAEKTSEKTAVPGGVPLVQFLEFRKLLLRESLIFILTFCFFAYWAFMGIDVHHDGVMLIPAIRVAQGAAVFKDVFCQYGLLVPLLQGLAVAIFGAELLVIRLLTVLFYAGSAVLLDLLWRRFLPAKISWSVPVLFSLLAPCTMATFHSWSSVYALFFMLGYAYCAVVYLERPVGGGNRWFLFIAGIAAGLTWACRMPCGAVTVLAAILVFAGVNFFTGKKIRDILLENLLFIAGVLTIALAAATYITVTGGWQDFIRQNFNYVTDFVHQRSSGSSWQFFCESLFPFYQDGLWLFNSLFAFIPICALVLLYFSCRKGLLGGQKEMNKNIAFIALLVLGLGSWHQYYPVACIRHLFWGGMPMLGAYILVIYKLYSNKKLLSKAALGGLILVLLSGLFVRFTGISLRGKIDMRVAGDMPGVKGILLSKPEKALVDIMKTGDNIPEHIARRGFLVLGEDSLFMAMVDLCDFKDTCFYSVKSKQYPEYETKLFRYIAGKRPMLISDQELFLPGYIIYKQCGYMGKNYCVLLPVN